MKVKSGFALAIVFTSVLLVPIAFAETTQELAEQCKKEAMDSGVPAGDVAAYVEECLSEHGVTREDDENEAQKASPADNTDGQQPSGSDAQ